jgi:hypothetical protein
MKMLNYEKYKKSFEGKSVSFTVEKLLPVRC